MQAWDMLSARYTHCWLESLELRDGEMVYIRIIENVGKKNQDRVGPQWKYLYGMNRKSWTRPWKRAELQMTWRLTKPQTATLWCHHCYCSQWAWAQCQAPRQADGGLSCPPHALHYSKSFNMRRPRLRAVEHLTGALEPFPIVFFSFGRMEI